MTEAESAKFLLAARSFALDQAQKYRDHDGRQFWVVAAEHEDTRRFIVHAHDMRTAFLELQAAIHSQLG
jgi:hypothetical protein